MGRRPKERPEGWIPPEPKVKKVKDDDDSPFKEPSRPIILVKLIERVQENVKVYQALDHRIYYQIAGHVYDKIPTIIQDAHREHVTLKEISLEEFDRLYTPPK